MEITQDKSHLEGQPLIAQPNASGQTNNVKLPTGLIAEVNNNLMSCPREDHLRILYEILQPSIVTVDQLYRAITCDLMQVLNKLGFYYKIHQLGSTFTGLAFRDSGFDTIIEIPNRIAPIAIIIKKIIKAMQTLKLFHGFLLHISSPKPFILCVHTATGYTCDIGFSPELSLVSNHVMKRLLSFDHRIHPLTYILKYWLRVHHLSGHMSTYCLFLLVVFYLQSPKIQILPPYCAFQISAPEIIIERFWNVGFNFNYSAPKNSAQHTQLSVPDLLLGFFAFYRDYDFEKNFISVMFGRSYSRDEFNASVPLEFKRYKLHLEQENAMKLDTAGLMCVQDPFMHCLNVANSNVANDKEMFDLFKAEVANSAELCQKTMDANETLSLYKLFNSFAGQSTETELRIKMEVKSVKSAKSADPSNGLTTKASIPPATSSASSKVQQPLKPTVPPATTESVPTKLLAKANRRKNKQQKNLQKLQVRMDRAHIRQVKKKQKQHAEDALQRQVNDNLLQCAEGDELKLLARILQPNNEDLFRVYLALQADLMQALNMRRTSYRIHPFGSTISGLAFKDSDFDLYIEMQHNNEPITKTIHILVGAMRQLQRFHEIVPITHARVPIIKCVHTPTGFSCDISFSNNFGVHNSQIIRHLVYYDYRIHPLTIILKYWMRTHELSGTGRITNYCLFMLIVFYLQSIPNPILPPFNTFQRNVPVVRVEHWNMAFNYDYVNQARNPMKVAMLLMDFFNFYADYDFQKNIICPLFARSYERKNFNANIPPEFKRYIDYMKGPDAQELNTSRLMCLQDPFNLCYNVASCTGKATYAKFIVELRNAAQLCAQELTNAPESAQFLYKLFNSHAKVIPVQPLTHIFIKDKRAGPFRCTLKPLEQELFVVRTVLKSTSPTTQVFETSDINRLWSQKLTEYVQETLKRFFLVELKAIDDGHKTPKLDGQGDVHAKSDQQQCFCATITHDVYRNRRVRKAISSDYIELEETASKKMAVAGTLINLKCTVKISASQECDQIQIEFSDETTNDGGEVPIKKKNLKLIFDSFIKTVRNHLKAFFQKYHDDNTKTKTVTISVEEAAAATMPVDSAEATMSVDSGAEATIPVDGSAAANEV